MAPTRRTKNNSNPIYPPSPPSEDDNEYHPHRESSQMASAGRHTPYQRGTSQGAGAAGVGMTGGNVPLQRGSACLSCRKRKMKCDGQRPICGGCTRANRSADCEYDDGKTKTRTQLLQEKIQRLEFRLQQLEGTAPDEGNATTNQAFMQSPGALVLQQRTQAFDFNVASDKDFEFDFGNAASSSATRVYDQEQMKRLIDAATGNDPTIGDSSWDNTGDGSHTQDASNDASDWQEDGLPPRVRQQLLEIVFPHLGRLNVDLHLPTFLQSLNLPPTHAMRPHPSLLHALYLHACALSPPDHYLHSHQAKFARKCREAISASLEFSDRIIDCLRAQCLLATYYFTVGRSLDGYALVCATARLAVGCELNRLVSPIQRTPSVAELPPVDYRRVAHVGLGIGLPTLAATAAASSASSTTPLLDSEGNLDVFHGIAASNLTHPRKISLGFGTGHLPPSSFAYDTQIHSPEPGRILGAASYPLVGGATARSAAQNKPNPILEPPRNARELGERILLFWRIFNMDRFWSVVCGLQPALSEDEIMTVWPRNMEDYQSGNVNDNEYSSVRSLGVRQPIANTRPDATATLVSKSITLFERSARLAASLSPAQPPTEAFWVAFRLMEDSIQQLTASIPSYKRRATGAFESMMGANSGNRSQADSHNPSPTGSVHSESPTTSNHMNYGLAQHNLGFVPVPSSIPPTTPVFGTGAPQIEIDETLVLVHILLCTASVQLHNIFAKEDEASYQKAVSAARTGAAIIAEVAETMNVSGECYDVMLGPCLTLLADILIRDAVRGGPAAMNNLEPELEAVIFVLKAVASHSPFVSRQAALVGAAKDALAVHHDQASDPGQRHVQHQIQVPTVLSMTLPSTPMLPFGSGAV
ncbi:hypothetical protein M408DRAFT_329249 [Serendipita vermifera MAFF 305830]|uniref:Zn(2)-C6 fungal-type domain-containing protein n=1 Tax=Serendipita vermifera MAFF 305830 TaxID=933852 RepID=A0A0C2WRK7_SERVB|nr:hypothetical protein M408DRAFT_329249 [Serendipita vermifera MAFF 305830]